MEFPPSFQVGPISIYPEELGNFSLAIDELLRMTRLQMAKQIYLHIKWKYLYSLLLSGF